MKLLVFSDTHLTTVVDQPRLVRLLSLVEQADRVILNGDFWDGYVVHFDDFVRSGWQQLFTALRAKDAIYLYGNHDAAQFADQRVNLFSTLQSDNWSTSLAGQNWHFEHGHRLYFTTDYYVTKLSAQLLHTSLWKWTTFLTQQVADRASGWFGDDPWKVLSRANHSMRQKANQFIDQDTQLVFGHTHFPQAAADKGFFNSGSFDRYWARYLWLDDSGMTLCEERL